jgi:hypothetical protein
VLVLCEAKTSNSYKAEEHEGHATHVDSRPAEIREKKPTKDDPKDPTSGKRNINVKRLELRKSRCLEKDDGIAQYSITTEDLTRRDHAVLIKVALARCHTTVAQDSTNNFGSPQVCSLKTFPKARISPLSLL